MHESCGVKGQRDKADHCYGQTLGQKQCQPALNQNLSPLILMIIISNHIFPFHDNLRFSRNILSDMICTTTGWEQEGL